MDTRLEFYNLPSAHEVDLSRLSPLPSLGSPVTTPPTTPHSPILEERTEEQRLTETLNKMDQSQVHLKTIQDKQVSSLQNMTKALDALAQILPPVMEKDKKRGRDDCIDHNHLTFKTMLAVFESTQPQKAAEFKKEEDLLNQQMKTSKTKQHNSYLQGKKSSFYRRRDAHILSQTLADCSKTIRNRTQELQATVATLQREQQELREELQALKKQKTQTGTNTQLECPLTPQTQAPASPFSLGSPSLLGPPSGLGSPSTFFSTPRLNPQSGADSGYDTEFAQPFTL